jgi:exodeoxyribonuclease VII small subunit
MSFEKSLKELQSLVKRLESGDLSLEDSLKAFESGVQLVRQCQEVLKSAEKRVQILSQNSTLEPFGSPTE